MTDFKLDTTGNTKYVFEFFPREYLELNLEICTQPHPKLQAIIAQYAMDEIDIKLAQIAAYCEVAMDGVYDFEARMTLCKILKDRLVLLREIPKGSIILLS